MRVFRVAGPVLLALLLLSLLPLAAQAQDRTLYWETYDVAITVQPDGCFRVVETQELVFTNGTFRFGVRTIPTEFTSSIGDVVVSEVGSGPYRRSTSGEPNTFDVTQAGGDLNIRYNFPPTSDASRTIVIEYTVCGGLLYYPDGDQLVWKAVPSNGSFPIQNASVTVRLPDGVTITNYDATGPRGAATLIDNGQAVRFVASEPIRPGGSDFAVRLQWPSGLVAGQPADWPDEAYAEMQGQRFAYQQRIVWRENWKYVFNTFDEDELYDLAADPHELRNLAADPGQRDVLEAMAWRMWRWVAETGDENMLTAQYGMFRFAPVGPERSI